MPGRSTTVMTDLPSTWARPSFFSTVTPASCPYWLEPVRGVGGAFRSWGLPTRASFISRVRGWRGRARRRAPPPHGRGQHPSGGEVSLVRNVLFHADAPPPSGRAAPPRHVAIWIWAASAFAQGTARTPRRLKLHGSLKGLPCTVTSVPGVAHPPAALIFLGGPSALTLTTSSGFSRSVPSESS